ncbi:MAG: UDP-3-O-(3-hydroxymyristoyl)glucosamine N-acyltransferase [Gemmatimonas sp.]|nr:UDP-3-O-(3-hydroxymyristoyl)glucosamine N-acyltransferase [Gemmatimonas sp.]
MSYPVNDKQIIRNCRIGEGTRIWNFVNMYECEVGRDSMIGTFVELQNGVKVGDRTRIQSHTFVCELVTIGDDVFVGHGVMFINDTMPPQPEKEKWKSTTIEDRASIGSNVTLLPVRIGHDAVVGAGSVVTKDVPPGAVVAGNPARLLRYKEGFGPQA